jgi:hypothetical protein
LWQLVVAVVPALTFGTTVQRVPEFQQSVEPQVELAGEAVVAMAVVPVVVAVESKVVLEASMAVK